MISHLLRLTTTNFYASKQNKSEDNNNNDDDLHASALHVQLMRRIRHNPILIRVKECRRGSARMKEAFKVVISPFSSFKVIN
jgi:hypothetical protein